MVKNRSIRNIGSIEKEPGKSEYTVQLGDADGIANASIRIGGEDSSVGNKFVPNVNVLKWNDECWLNINHQETVVTSEKESFIDGELALTIGELVYRYSVENGRLKYGIDLLSRPATNVLEFDLDFSEGLEFGYQNTLEDEWKKEPRGLSLKEYLATRDRSDDTIGSYAVYWRKAHNQYRTGKFCHIYRPKLTDAEGNSCWAEWELDLEHKKLRLIMDGDWLDNAVYPIDPDYTIGYASVGSSSWDTDDQIYMKTDPTAEEDGVAKTLHYAPKNTGEYKVALYADDKSRLSNEYTDTGTGGVFDSVDISGESITITQGVDYHPAFAIEQGTGGRYDGWAAGGPFYCWTNGASYEMPDPFPSCNDESNYRVSCYLTYGTVDYYHGLKVQGEAAELALCDVGTNPLRIRKGATTYGIELVETADGNASRVRIKLAAGVKSLRKYT